MIRIRAFLLLSIFLASCATVTPGTSPEEQQAFRSKTRPPIAPKNVLAVTSALPEDDSKSKTLSVWLWDCGYFVHRIGSAHVATDKIARLEAAIVDALGSQQVAGKPLVVKKYSIYVNNERIQTADSVRAGFGGGAIAPMIASAPDGRTEKITMEPKCKRDRMEGGWFDPADLTRNASPVTVDIEADFDGKSYVATAAFSPPIEIHLLAPKRLKEGDPLKPAVDYSIQQAMDKANARLIEDIRGSAQQDLPESKL